MTNNLSDLTEGLIATAKSAGADACDAIAVDGTSISIDVRDGALEHAERSEGIEVGLRVLIGQKQACVSASDTKPDTLRMMAERAVAMAAEAPDDPYAGLADASQLTTNTDTASLELFDPSEEPDPAALQDDAARAEAAALQNKGVSQVQSASAGIRGRIADCHVWQSAEPEPGWNATMTTTVAFFRTNCAAPKTSARVQRQGRLNAPAHANPRPALIQSCLTNASQAA